jgi:hypothetical protein
MTEQNVFSIQTQSDQKIQWGNLNRNHDDDPIISELVNIAVHNNVKDSMIHLKFDDFIMYEFNQLLKKNNLPIYIPIEELKKQRISISSSAGSLEIDKKKKKEKVVKLSNKDKIKLQIEQDNKKKEIQEIFNWIKINDFYPIKKNNPLDCYINIIYWALYILQNHGTTPSFVLYDCALSLGRMNEEYRQFLDENIQQENLRIIKNIEKIIKNNDASYMMNLIKLYPSLINACYWDNNKPQAIRLYEEQYQLLDTVMHHLNENLPLLLFYWVPPANGKTLICNILAKLISKYNYENKKKNGFRRKSILYICYNDIVRNSVSQLCTTHNVDIKFWFANYHKDMFKDYNIVDFRPYKNCFPDWRKPISANVQKRDKKNEDLLFSPNVREQWNEYLQRTRLHKEREDKGDIKDCQLENADNIPEMVIADLASAEILLKEFPDLFIPYFDEAFAASEEMITAEIMKALPSISILVSATLAYPAEIPHTIQNFKSRHSIDHDDFIVLIKNDIQLINCDFISPDGNIISPHHCVNNVNELTIFIRQLQKYPIIQRGYSNIIVYEMYKRLESILPSEMKIKHKFPYLGTITNSNLRSYGIELINYVSQSQDEEIFTKIKMISIPMIKDNSIENMMTKNSYFYQDKNTLHVANVNSFMNYVTDMTHELLHNSPKLKNLIASYEKSKHDILKKIESFEKNNKNDKHFLDIQNCQEQLELLKINYSEEFIWNSFSYLKKFNCHSKISNYNKPLVDINVIQNLDDITAKLFLSHIGVYNQVNMNLLEMDTFLAYKDKFKFIMSDPSIIFGTNINITLIDIHENMRPILTRNKMYQMIGRAGRIGKSSSASVIFRSWDLFQIIIHDNDENIEAQQIETNIQKIL